MPAAPRWCNAPGGDGRVTPISWGRCPSSAVTASSPEKEAHQVIEDEDARGAGDHGGVDGAADAGRPAFGGQAEVAAGERDDQAEDQALDQPVGHVAEVKPPPGEPVV